MALTTETQLFQVQEAQGFVVNPSPSVLGMVMVANTAQNISISDLADVNGKLPTYLIFSFDGPFWVLWNGDNAAIPSVSSNLNGTAPERSPTSRKITNSITKFSIVSAANNVGSIALYRGN